MFFRHNNLCSFIITNSIERLFSLYHTPSENTLSSFLKEFHKKRGMLLHIPPYTAFSIYFFALPALLSALLPQPSVPHHTPSDTAQTVPHHIPPAVLLPQDTASEFPPVCPFPAAHGIPPLLSPDSPLCRLPVHFIFYGSQLFPHTGYLRYFIKSSLAFPLCRIHNLSCSLTDFLFHFFYLLFEGITLFL